MCAGEKWQNGDRDLSSYVGLVQKLVRSGVAKTYEKEVKRAAQDHLSIDMDTSIVYDGMAHTLSFGGETYSAYNNVQSKANGPYPNGTYGFSHIVYKHEETTFNQRIFGSVANVVFHVPGRSGMGIHSGREHDTDKMGKSGMEHCTDGCIRTTDEVMSRLVVFAAAKNPALVVKNNEDCIADYTRRKHVREEAAARACA